MRAPLAACSRGPSPAAGTPAKPKRRRKGAQSTKGKRLRKAKKVKGAEKERQGSQEQSGQDDYWDEEDELEEYIMKRDLGQIKEHSAGGSDSSRSDSEGALSACTCLCWCMWERRCRKNAMLACMCQDPTDGANAGNLSFEPEGADLAHMAPGMQRTNALHL